MRPSPLQIIKKSFESRQKLVNALMATADKLNGDTEEKVRSRLMGLSNAKLLRLHRVEQTVRERFGDRAKLVEHIVAARVKAGLTADQTFRDTLANYTKARLLDMTKMVLPAKPAKLTAEAKLAIRRGRKARERALSKLAK